MPLYVSFVAKEPMAKAGARAKAEEEDVDVGEDAVVAVAKALADEVPRAGAKVNPHSPTDAR